VPSRKPATSIDELAGIRGRVGDLCAEWESHHDVTTVIRRLDELASSCVTYPSIQALLFGAARLIEGGDDPGRRLEKLSDHLHGYVIGWEDGVRSSTTDYG